MEYNLDKLSKKVLKYIAKEHEINPMKHIELLKNSLALPALKIDSK